MSPRRVQTDCPSVLPSQEIVMSNGRFIFRCFAVALLPFLSAITTAYAADPPAQQRPNTKALVAGSAEALADFDKKLLTYLKAESMAQANVGCTGCSAPQKDAVTQQPTRTYTFVQSSDIVGKVMAAWSDVKGKGVTLTFSDYKQPEPDCGPPKPQPCVSNYNCGDLGYCSATRPFCRACGT
jgi:hypothetical protein